MYDSRPDTQAHIDQVRALVDKAAENLIQRANVHDASKLVQPELESWDIATPKLAETEYPSEEYRQTLRELKPAIQHHYEHNDHHPEHFEKGVNGMSLMGLIEMLCDWKAASLRTKNGSFDLDYNFERFGIEPQLADVLRNTARELGLT